MRTAAADGDRIRSRRLLPAFGHSPCLIGKGPPLLDLGWIVDASWLAEKVSPPLQQRCGADRGELHAPG